jgi:hypothetical protein
MNFFLFHAMVSICPSVKERSRQRIAAQTFRPRLTSKRRAKVGKGLAWGEGCSDYDRKTPERVVNPKQKQKPSVEKIP